MTGLLELVEDLMLPHGRYLQIARLGSRWFVLVCERGGRPSDFEVRGPFDSRPDAASHARAVQARAFEGAAE